MIENERRILSFSRQRGMISKPELCRSSEVNCGWATASKLIDRLVEDEVLVVAGTDGIRRRYGKNAIAYRLNDSKHLVVAIDVEKTVTRIGVVALGGALLSVTVRPTPAALDYDALKDFLAAAAETALTADGRTAACFAGIGIGIPITAELARRGGDVCAELEKELETRFGLDCRVANNIAVLGEYFRCSSGLADFALLGIRTGIGGAVVVNNRLYRGMGAAGEFGNFNAGGGKPGGLETEVSFHALNDRFAARTGKRLAGMTELFDLAAAGNDDALAVGWYFAAALLRLFEALRCILDPPRFIVAGDFGPHGNRLERLIAEQNPVFAGRINYRETGGDDFLAACAMQIQHRYFI
jgi:predicted NBD/HSP70 family sugar kinase